MTAEAKTLTILGATGSVGLSTIDLVRAAPERFKVVVITAHKKVKELAELARELKPKFVVIGQDSKFDDLKQALAGTGIECGAGTDALIEAANRPSDIVMAAIVGAAGLRPALAAVRRGATVALANKECLVCAGDLMMQEVAKYGARLLPVDSEHNAIFQVLNAEQPQTVSRLILTASGGPFLGRSAASLCGIKPAEAVAHPKWDMGAKISVDSATMMNKGLEVIEAYHLFPVNKNQIDVLIHPQSVVHSMVEYIDGSTLAQLGSPDMRIPIASCLAWPERMATPAKRLDLADIGSLTFEEPDLEMFTCLRLARDAMLAGGAFPAILNAANEVAVEAFLSEKLGFLDISRVVEETLTRCDIKAPHSIANVMEIDREARAVATAVLSQSRR